MKNKKKSFISLSDFAEVFKQPGIVIVCVVSLFVLINLIYFKFLPGHTTDLPLYGVVIALTCLSSIAFVYMTFPCYLYSRTQGSRYKYRIIKYLIVAGFFYLLSIIVILFVHFYVR